MITIMDERWGLIQLLLLNSFYKAVAFMCLCIYIHFEISLY